MHQAFVGLGSNLDAPAGQVRAAIAALGGLEQTHLLRVSSLYQSAPVGFLDQPDFINAVAEIETALEPQILLRRLFDIERTFGRIREFKDSPRTLDLDLLLYDQAALDLPGLIVPHPRMHERAFVLRPLAEIAPGVRLPVHGTIQACLAQLLDQPIERLID